jgi:hypothetical protein
MGHPANRFGELVAYGLLSVGCAGELPARAPHAPPAATARATARPPIPLDERELSPSRPYRVPTGTTWQRKALVVQPGTRLGPFAIGAPFREPPPSEVELPCSWVRDHYTCAPYVVTVDKNGLIASVYAISKVFSEVRVGAQSLPVATLGDASGLGSLMAATTTCRAERRVPRPTGTTARVAVCDGVCFADFLAHRDGKEASNGSLWVQVFPTKGGHPCRWDR